MSHFQRKLRLYIATGSVIGFLGGWALLAHAGKPASSASSVSTAPLVQSITLPPIDFNALEAASNSAPAQTFVQPSFQAFGRARLRTGGS